MPLIRWSLWLVLLGAGCNPALFRDTDDGRRVGVDVDRVFTVSLPDSAEMSAPEVQGRAVRFLSCRPSDDRHLFEFRADHPGSAQIRMYRVKGEPPQSVPAFTLLVDVYEPVRPVLRRGVRSGLFVRVPARCRRR